MRLLLVEDDAALGRATCVFLMRAGHAVDWATNGNQALSLLGKFEFDCIVLDLGLPEIGGRDCLRNIRVGDNTTPVIVTSSESGLDNRIQLLDMGADDYLVKPYDLAELAARLKAIVRRSQNTEAVPDHVQAYGPLTLTPSSKVVTWHGRSVELTPTEFRVLAFLLRRQGSIVPRPRLEAEVYGPGDHADSNCIEVHVHHLRRKLDTKLIQTQRGVGYQINLC